MRKVRPPEKAKNDIRSFINQNSEQNDHESKKMEACIRWARTLGQESPQPRPYPQIGFASSQNKNQQQTKCSVKQNLEHVDRQWERQPIRHEPTHERIKQIRRRQHRAE